MFAGRPFAQPKRAGSCRRYRVLDLSAPKEDSDGSRPALSDEAARSSLREIAMASRKVSSWPTTSSTPSYGAQSGLDRFHGLDVQMIGRLIEDQQRRRRCAAQNAGESDHDIVGEHCARRQGRLSALPREALATQKPGLFGSASSVTLISLSIVVKVLSIIVVTVQRCDEPHVGRQQPSG